MFVEEKVRHAITLNREILNQSGFPVMQIISEGNQPTCDGQFYSFGDIVVHVDLVLAIVRMSDDKPSEQKQEILNG